MEKKEIAEKYISYLGEEGYRATIDADGDVQFKKEGLVYLILIDANDDKLFRVGCPNIWNFANDAQRIRVLAACDAANSGTKAAKMFTVKNGVWVSAEMFLSEQEGYKPILERVLAAMQYAMQVFLREMSAPETSGTETAARTTPPTVPVPPTI